MTELIEWFSNMEHTKPLALVLFFLTFVGILVYVFTGKQRTQRLESYKFIPFEEKERPQAQTTEKGRQDG